MKTRLESELNRQAKCIGKLEVETKKAILSLRRLLRKKGSKP